MSKRGEEIGRKNRRETDRERNLWEDKRPEGVIVRVWEERKKAERREEWESLLLEMLNEQKKILFPESEEYNMYSNHMPHEREIVFPKKKNLENNL